MTGGTASARTFGRIFLPLDAAPGNPSCSGMQMNPMDLRNGFPAGRRSREAFPVFMNGMGCGPVRPGQGRRRWLDRRRAMLSLPPMVTRSGRNPDGAGWAGWCEWLPVHRSADPRARRLFGRIARRPKPGSWSAWAGAAKMPESTRSRLATGHGVTPLGRATVTARSVGAGRCR